MIYEVLIFIIAVLFVIVFVFCAQGIVNEDDKMNKNRKKIYKGYMQDLADCHNKEIEASKEEIEKFRNKNKVLKEENKKLKKENKKLKKENERFKERVQQLQINNTQRLQNEIEMLKTTIMRNEAYIERMQHKGPWRK